MAITVNWLNEEQTIIHWQFSGTWNWEQFYKALERNNVLARSVSHPYVATLLNFESTKYIPQNPLIHFRSWINKAYPKQGVIVAVNAPVIMEYIVSITRNSLSRKREQFVSFDNPTKALQYIHDWFYVEWMETTLASYG